MKKCTLFGKVKKNGRKQKVNVGPDQQYHLLTESPPLPPKSCIQAMLIIIRIICRNQKLKCKTPTHCWAFFEQSLVRQL